MENTLNDMMYFTASKEVHLAKSPSHVTENRESFLFSPSTIYTLTPRMPLKDISGERGLAPVMALHESLRMKYVILKTISWVFKGKIEMLFQVPG